MFLLCLLVPFLSVMTCIGFGSQAQAPARFRTIQVLSQDLAAGLRQVDQASLPGRERACGLAGSLPSQIEPERPRNDRKHNVVVANI
jgi:hypothetical protein